MEDIYSQVSLYSGPRRLRLLSVESIINDVISVSLRADSLDNSPSYTAISYVWGTTESRMPIWINGHYIDRRITPNLYSLLRQLHTDREAHNLWIDAICLNQDDQVEIKQQVPKMGDVYTQAQRTYIWLGLSEDGSDLAMDLVKGICDDDFMRYSPELPQWLAHKKLFKRDWWTRVWTLQEALLSRFPIVKCGGKEVELERFVDFEYLYYEQRTLLQAKHHEKFWGMRYYLQVPYQAMFWRDIQEQLDGPLSLWFPFIRQFRCSINRDKVFGVLGLLRPCSRNFIEVDYDTNNKSDIDIFTRAGVLLFAESGLRWLSFAQDAKDPNSGLPSWCPDWTVISPYMNLISLKYPASSITLPEWCIKETYPLPYTRHEDLFRFSADLRTIVVRGFIVDIADSVNAVPIIPLDEQQDDRESIAAEKYLRRETALKACRAWIQHVRARCATSYNGNWKEAFWRTLICNVTGRNEPAPGSYEAAFDGWIDEFTKSARSPSEDDKGAMIWDFGITATATTYGRSFFTTPKGYFGLALQHVRPHDCICVLNGGFLPVILRRLPSKQNHWTFISDAYVHDIMDGEYLKTAKLEELEEFWII
jgi:hypothetical protein